MRSGSQACDYFGEVNTWDGSKGQLVMAYLLFCETLVTWVYRLWDNYLNYTRDFCKLFCVSYFKKKFTLKKYVLLGLFLRSRESEIPG